jgi:tRNA 2-selenouridine synthase
MPKPLATLLAPVHPHQIEVQDFSTYALIVDARPRESFEVDHLPGAVCVPRASNDSRSLADLTSQPGERSGSSLPQTLATHVAGLAPGDTILVYCDQGGLDAHAWAQPLRDAGWAVDVLAGGWGNYRRWVTAGLEVLPRMLTMRRLLAPPVGGLCRVLAVLHDQGEQVLDVTELCGQKLVPGLTLKGDRLPTQDGFETRLLDALRNFDPERSIWVRCGPAPLQGLTLPPAFSEALERAEQVVLDVPVGVRARAWLARLQAMDTPMETLLDALGAKVGPPPRMQLESWAALSAAGRPIDALTEIIAGYIDPTNVVSSQVASADALHVASLDHDEVAPVVRDWLQAHPRPAPVGARS